MGREIISRRDIASAPRKVEHGKETTAVADSQASDGKEPDKYKDRLMKNIPGEVITLWVTLAGLIAGKYGDDPGAAGTRLLWIAFFVGFFGTPIYLSRVGKVKKRVQLLISTGAFVVWVFALGGPFATFPWYDPFLGAFVLPIYTFALATIDP